MNETIKNPDFFWAPAVNVKPTNSINEKLISHQYLKTIMQPFDVFLNLLDLNEDTIRAWLDQFASQIDLHQFNQILFNGDYEQLKTLDYLKPVIAAIKWKQLIKILNNEFTNNYWSYLADHWNYKKWMNWSTLWDLKKAYEANLDYNRGLKITIYNKYDQINNFIYLTNGQNDWLNWELIFYLLKRKLIAQDLILQPDQMSFWTKEQIITNLKQTFILNQKLTLKDWYMQMAYILVPKRALHHQHPLLAIYQHLLKHYQLLDYQFSFNKFNHLGFNLATIKQLNEHFKQQPEQMQQLNVTNFENYLKTYDDFDQQALICKNWLTKNQISHSIHQDLFNLSEKLLNLLDQEHCYQFVFQHSDKNYYLIPVAIEKNLWKNGEWIATDLHCQYLNNSAKMIWNAQVKKLLTSNYGIVPQLIFDYDQPRVLAPNQKQNDLQINYKNSFDFAQQRIIDALCQNQAKEKQLVNLCCDAPAGVGKTQTLVNVITNSFYLNKRLLVVTEKTPAIKIIQKRFFQTLMDKIGRFVQTYVDPNQWQNFDFSNWLKTQYEQKQLINQEDYCLFLKIDAFVSHSKTIDWNYIYSIDYDRNDDRDYQKFLKELKRFVKLEGLYFCAFTNTSDHKTMFLTKTLYDLIIFDEGSQIDLNQARLLFNLTKQIAVFGDLKQLKPEHPLSDYQWSKQVNQPLIDLLTWAQMQNDWDLYRLNVSYRCENNDLLKWSNQKVYDNQLISVDQNLPKVMGVNQGIKYLEIEGVYKNQTNQDQIKAGLQWTIDLIWFNTKHNLPIDIMHLSLQNEHQRELKAQFKKIIKAPIYDKQLSQFVLIWSNLDWEYKHYFQNYFDQDHLLAMHNCDDQEDFNDLDPKIIKAVQLFQKLIANLVDPHLAIQFKTIETMQGAEANDVLCHGVYGKLTSGRFSNQYQIFSTPDVLNAINVIMSRAKKSFTLLNSLNLDQFKTYLQTYHHWDVNRDFYDWINFIKIQAQELKTTGGWKTKDHSPYLDAIQKAVETNDLISATMGNFAIDALKIDQNGQVEYAIKINDQVDDQNFQDHLLMGANLLKLRDYPYIEVKVEQLQWFEIFNDLEKTAKMFKKINAKQKAWLNQK